MSSDPTRRWIAHRRPAPDANVRLFCLPYAGGGASVYRAWAGALPPSIEVCPVQLPGREGRFSEAPFTRMPALIDAAVDALAAEIDRPYALFGHSLGAVVAFEIARRLARLGHTPRHLFVSAHRAPWVPSLEPPAHALPEAKFITVLRRLGGTPEEVLRDPELLELVLPTLRADFAVSDTYQPAAGDPLPCDITSLRGSRDAPIGEADVEPWGRETSGRFRSEVLDGGHFFLDSARARVLAIVAEDLSPYLG